MKRSREDAEEPDECTRGMQGVMERLPKYIHDLKKYKNKKLAKKTRKTRVPASKGLPEEIIFCEQKEKLREEKKKEAKEAKEHEKDEAIISGIDLFRKGSSIGVVSQEAMCVIEKCNRAIKNTTKVSTPKSKSLRNFGNCFDKAEKDTCKISSEVIGLQDPKILNEDGKKEEADSIKHNPCVDDTGTAALIKNCPIQALAGKGALKFGSKSVSSLEQNNLSVEYLNVIIFYRCFNSSTNNINLQVSPRATIGSIMEELVFDKFQPKIKHSCRHKYMIRLKRSTELLQFSQKVINLINEYENNNHLELYITFRGAKDCLCFNFDGYVAQYAGEHMHGFAHGVGNALLTDQKGIPVGFVQGTWNNNELTYGEYAACSSTSTATLFLGHFYKNRPKRFDCDRFEICANNVFEHIWRSSRIRVNAL